MDLKDAIKTAMAAHSEWKVKFRDFMAGKLDLDGYTVQKNNACTFGKWLETEGKAQLTRADFDDINRLHTDFHRNAGDVVNKKKTGDINGAQSSLSPLGTFSQASAALSKKMMEVSSKI